MTPRPAFTGVCRFCGCGASEDESHACTTPTGDLCHWHDFERTVCSNPPCIVAFDRERAQFKADRDRRNKKKTPAEIHALIRRGTHRRPSKARYRP
ncbi:MAG: hypothetical protein WA708_01850 [Acidobacteriaceae bacterium]